MDDRGWPAYACPEHGHPLREEEGSLVCPAGERYPVLDQVPRFVASDAYTAAFGAQWKRYRKTQLDSFTGTQITRTRIRRALGERLWEEIGGMHVLECGCGAGRFTEVLLERGARVTSVDLSVAVDANRENFPVGDAHRIAQADITRLPFRPQQFDVVFCLGVIQHTPDTELTIRRLFEHVRPGGVLVIDHYSRDYKRSWYTKTAPLFREVLKRLPAEKGMKATETLVDVFLPAHRFARRSRLLQVITSRISPVITYYHAYPQLNDELQREWALLDTHDALTDWYKRFRSRGQIRRTLEELGARVEWCEYGGNGVEARAVRPAEPGSGARAA